MKHFLLAGFFCLTGIVRSAQEQIETGRPGQTETPSLVPRGWFQAETGFTKENHDGNHYTLVHPTAWLTYGFLKKFEF